MNSHDSGASGVLEVRGDTRLATIFLRYRDVRLLGRADATTVKYEIELRRLDLFLGRPATMADLSDQVVSALLRSMKAEGRSIPTANKTRSCLLALWRWCAAHRYVNTWPDILKLHEPERIPLAWSEPELLRLFASLRSLKGRVCKAPAADWWVALHLVIWDTAERIGAVLGLEWSHLDLATGWLVIPAELRKGKTRDKAHRLHKETIRSLVKLRRTTPGSKVFPWPRTGVTLWAHYRAILAAAHLATDRKSKFHRLRRTVATQYEMRGGNATELLDHSKRSVTTQSYLDPRFLKSKQASDILPRPGKKRTKPR